MYRGHGKEEHDATTRDRQGMGCCSRPEGGGSRREVDVAGRGSKGSPGGRNLGSTGTWEQIEYGKGGKPEEGRQTQARASKYFGLPVAGGRGHHPGGRSLRDRASGVGEKRVQIDREEASTGESWGGTIGDRTGGRGKEDP